MMDRPNFEAWWEEHGQYGRAGGGEYEKTFAYNAWVSQAERIRVLREALEVAKNGLGWWQESCPELVTECDHEAMAQIDAALEATK